LSSSTLYNVSQTKVRNTTLISDVISSFYQFFYSLQEHNAAPTQS